MNIIKRIGTHSGNFHADEVTGVMLLRNFASQFLNAEIVRTRDPSVLAQLDIIIDVGDVYDPARQRYDHHQKGFFETFSEGHKTKLSSAGLVYKHYGKEIIENALRHVFDEQKLIDKKYQVQLSADEIHLLWLSIYDDFIEYIDAVDNGIDQYPKEVVPRYKTQYTDLVARIGRLNRRSFLKETLTQDELFVKAMELAKQEFLSEVTYKFADKFMSLPIVKDALEKRMEVHPSGRIIHVECACNWKTALIRYEKETKAEGHTLFVLYRDELDGNYRVQAVPLTPGSFDLRQGLRAEWRGLRNEDLEAASGIPGGVFCHATGFIGVGKTFETVLAMATASLPTQ